MRAITKGQEPASLTAHRQRPHSDFFNYTGKYELRHTLTTEQRGLCCYCMGRIDNRPTTMKIEHWKSQARYPVEQLKYLNLLGACLGNQGQPGYLQHCDTRKGNRDLHWNPADPTHHIETRVRYELDGTIRSDENTFDVQLNDVLNLNHPTLRNGRKGVVAGVLDWWKGEKQRTKGPLSRGRLERERARHIDGDAKLTPYCQVAVWLLEQRLLRMA